MLTSPVLFNLLQKVLARAIKQDKEMKGVQMRKEEVKLSLCATMIIIYVYLYIKSYRLHQKDCSMDEKNSAYLCDATLPLNNLYTDPELFE
jgi:hypothetical protein